jgi:hypothetical protein
MYEYCNEDKEEDIFGFALFKLMLIFPIQIIQQL